MIQPFVLSVLAATTAGSVQTLDTAIRIEATPQGIRIAGLRAPGQPSWADGTLATPLIDYALIDGREVALKWVLEGNCLKSGNSLCIRYRCSAPRLELVSTWQGSSGAGPIEHRLAIVNHDARTVSLPLQDSLDVGLRARDRHRLENWWVEKSAGGPSDVGTHTESIGPGYVRTLSSTPYSEDQRRDAIPWCSIQDTTSNRGVYFGIEFSGRVRIDVSSARTGGLSVRAGITPEPSFATRLRAGETFRAPTVFVGCYRGSVDDGANRMRQWLRASVCPPVRDSKYPLLTLNSWGSGMAIDEKLADSMSRNAARLGLELFHVDAGWFRQVGDWRYNPGKFPGGLRAVSDRVHALGLRFGLWTGWTQGGIANEVDDPEAILNVFSPQRRNWIANPPEAGWKPQDFIGSDVCLSSPEAQAWSDKLLDRLVNEYRVDMLEHDQRMIVQNCVHDDHSHTASHGDIAYRAALGYYSVYDQLRRQHPNLLFEDCVNGGRMVDFGVMRRVNYVSISDTYTPVPNRQAVYDNTFALPPAMCECYVSDREPVHSLGEFVSMLRSGMMGWFSLMQDPARWTPTQFRAAKREFALYRTRLRPLILRGNLYHASARPDGKRWDGIQFASLDGSRAALFAFRGSQGPDRHTFPIAGLDARASYTVEFVDGGRESSRITGAKLMRDGLRVDLGQPITSQIVFMAKL